MKSQTSSRNISILYWNNKSTYIYFNLIYVSEYMHQTYIHALLFSRVRFAIYFG